MKYNNGYRKSSAFEIFKIIFQIIGTFIILMVIGMSLVLALSAGKMEDKINDIKNYTLRMFGMEEKTLKEEENPIASNLGNDARRLAVNKDSGKIVENKSEPISIDTNNSGVQTPAAGNINIGKQKEEPIKIPVNNNTKSENLVVNNMYYSQLNDYGKVIYNKLRSESRYFLDGEHVFDYGTFFDKLLQLEGGKEALNQAFQAAVNALMLDYPELFFVDVRHISLSIVTKSYPGLGPIYYVSISNTQGTKFYLDYLKTREEVEKAMTMVQNVRNNIISRIKSTDTVYEKVRIIHDYLVDNITYDDTSQGELKHTLLAALIYNRAVCEGYAKSFKYIADGLRNTNNYCSR